MDQNINKVSLLYLHNRMSNLLPNLDILNMGLSSINNKGHLSGTLTRSLKPELMCKVPSFLLQPTMVSGGLLSDL